MITKTGTIKEGQEIDSEAQLVFYAFNRVNFDKQQYETIKEKFPKADLVGFSTSGHFTDATIYDDKISFASLHFEKASYEIKSYNPDDYASSLVLGNQISADFKTLNDLKGLLIIADGSKTNGTFLIEGVNKELNPDTPIFGGMAGDSARFEKTLVDLNKLPLSEHVIVIGFRGNLQIQTGCCAGWKEMEIEYTITKSVGNELIEVNHKNAYDELYTLLAPKDDADFTNNTLFFPFQLTTKKGDQLIRTPIAVDHKNKRITYAGEMPEGCVVKLMKAGSLNLLKSTTQACEEAHSSHNSQFVFATSCVGRRVVLDKMANEEFLEIKDVFPKDSKVFGFYSYGEFARNNNTSSSCLLHNQTFTIASIYEN